MSFVKKLFSGGAPAQLAPSTQAPLEPPERSDADVQKAAADARKRAALAQGRSSTILTGGLLGGGSDRGAGKSLLLGG